MIVVLDNKQQIFTTYKTISRTHGSTNSLEQIQATPFLTLHTHTINIHTYPNTIGYLLCKSQEHDAIASCSKHNTQKPTQLTAIHFSTEPVGVAQPSWTSGSKGWLVPPWAGTRGLCKMSWSWQGRHHHHDPLHHHQVSHNSFCKMIRHRWLRKHLIWSDLCLSQLLHNWLQFGLYFGDSYSCGIHIHSQHCLLLLLLINSCLTRSIKHSKTISNTHQCSQILKIFKNRAWFSRKRKFKDQ